MNDRPDARPSTTIATHDHRQASRADRARRAARAFLDQHRAQLERDLRHHDDR